MSTYYVYDISEFMGDEPLWAFPESGLYEGRPSSPISTIRTRACF